MILWPEDFSQSEAAVLAGGKARALAALLDAPVQIPAWFAVLPDAGVVEVQTAVQQLLGGSEFLAVRSSALDEDGSAHSFAGQLDTFLHVSPGEVWERVQLVRASGQSERVLAYRGEHGLPLPPPPTAVLVQRMIDPLAAGVAFSADPVSGRRRVTVVAAVIGLGDALVSGEANADTWFVDDTGTLVERQLAGNEPVLCDERVRAVAQLVRAAERFFGRPQDIEWALDATGVWLLQSRPITTLKDVADPDGAAMLWDNSNIAESYGGITLPLTFSFARIAYAEVYRQFCTLLGVPRDKLVENANLFRQMLGIFRGHVYYNLLNWYRVLALLPGFRTNRRFMETMMGVKEALPDDVVQQMAAGSAWRDLLRLGQTVAGMLRAYAGLEREITVFYKRLNDALGQRTPDLSRLRADELASYYRRLETQLLSRWNAPLVNDFFAMIAYGTLRQLCAKWCGDAAGTLQNDLLSAQGGVISTEPATRVRQLADLCLSDPVLTSVLATGTLRQCRAAIAANQAFSQAIEEYVERFGDRCMDELKLESATLRDDPLPLLRSIANLTGYARTSQTSILKERAEERVRVALSGKPFRRMIFVRVLRIAGKRVVARENLRFERTRVFGRVRLIFLELGRRLMAMERLLEPRDVFYLEVEEVLGFVEGHVSCVDLAGLVEVRRHQYQEYEQGEAPPARFETRGAVNAGGPLAKVEPTNANGSLSWQGTGACPGIVRGRVQVVRDPRNAHLERGDILVAERTDPGWVLLFPLAAGLLVERGSLLSHSAIVARELGLPAIVGIAGITGSLKNGDSIEMDGASGRVRLIRADDN